MEALLYCLLAIFINSFLGACVWVSIDSKDERYYRWYKEAPGGGMINFIILTFWPIGLYLHLKHRWHGIARV